ncbi:MAG: HupE/UreJ family protein [Pseudomonadales bacterium]
MGAQPGGSRLINKLSIVALALFWASAAAAHTVAGSDGDFLNNASGMQLGPYLYLGAKHMVTGIDHLLFLAGVIFFLRSARDVALYATLFAVGHSITLLAGVLNGWLVNVYLVDALIAVSVIYKAMENLGLLDRWQTNLSAAVFSFGLVHGLGLASKLQSLTLDREAITSNMIAFNVGVELGQLLALLFMWMLLRPWQRQRGFDAQAAIANWCILTFGLILFGYQLTGFLLSR